MANTRNDDMDRKGNKNTPQDNTSQGQGGNFNQHTTGNAQTGQMGNQGRDPVNQDRAMNRDKEMGQGSSGTEQGRQGQPGTTGNTGSRGSTGSGERGGSTGKGSMGTDE
jgi:hypothetical protein